MRVHNESPKSRSSLPGEAAQLTTPVLGAETKAATAPMETLGTILARVAWKALHAHSGWVLPEATCLGAHPTLPQCFPPAAPTMSPAVWLDPLLGAQSAHQLILLHPGRPAQWLAGLPWTWVSQTKVHSFLAAKWPHGQLLGEGCARDAPWVELLEEVWANARGICGSAGALPQPGAT